MKLKVIPNDEFFLSIERIIKSGQTLELKVKGISMHPTLKNGKHKVVLAPFQKDDLKIGMIALFLYNQRHVLHRLVASSEEKLVFQGDNLPYTKEITRQEDIIATVVSIITPKGRLIDCMSKRYKIKSRLFVKINRPRIILMNKIRGFSNKFVNLLRRSKKENNRKKNRMSEQRKTKVLFFLESLAGGGAERILSIIATHIDKEKFDVTVSSITQGVYSDKVREVVKYKPFIKTKSRYLYKILYRLIYKKMSMKWIYRLFMPKHNDIEIAFLEGFATKLMAVSPAKRKIAWVHTDMINNPWTKSCFPSIEEEKRAYENFDDIICVSNQVREAFETKYGLSATTLYNPVDGDAIIDMAKEDVDIPAKTRTRFITTGRLIEVKGYDRLLKVTKMLKDDGYDFEIWIIGDGEKRSDLTQYIKENDLENNIKLWGFISNPFPFLASADVFVCSSRCEGFSTATTEAIILGLPVITTLCAGMTELLGENNEYGYIVENEDLALFEPMKRAINDPSFLEEFRLKSARRGGDFKIDTLMKPIEELLLK